MFNILRECRMKLKPLKCHFGVASGKFLEFIVNARGIEANPEKIWTIQNLKTPRTIKQVQSLNGKMTALSRFISKSTNKYIPFFDLIRKGKQNIEWNEECKGAFRALVQHLSTPPILSKPIDHERLYIYLAVSENAISAALIREEDFIQRLVNYISTQLTGVERNYPKLEKMAYCLVVASRKLYPYFQALPSQSTSTSHCDRSLHGLRHLVGY